MVGGFKKAKRSLTRFSAFASLILGTVAAAETPTDASRLLEPAEYQRLLRAVILVENKFAEDNRPSLLTRPMSPNCAMLKCGATQEELAYLLLKQGVPQENLILVQTEEIFGKKSLAHAMLFYKTKNAVDGKPLLIAFDPTFPQFASFGDGELMAEPAAAVLAGTAAGRAIISGSVTEGLWVVDEVKLAAFQAALTVDKNGRPSGQPAAKLKTLKPASYHRATLEKIAARPRDVADYFVGRSLDDVLDSVDAEKIGRRVRIGEKRASEILQSCRHFYKILMMGG